MIAMPKNKPPRDFRLELVKLKLARRKRKQYAMARCRGARCVHLVSASGLQLIVHPSTYRGLDGQWQLTTLGEDGTPYGHCNAPTFEEAILRAVGASNDNYWNKHGYEIVKVV